MVTVWNWSHTNCSDIVFKLSVEFSYDFVGRNVPSLEIRGGELHDQILGLVPVSSDKEALINKNKRECSQECTCTSVKVSLFHLISCRNGASANWIETGVGKCRGV